MTSSGLTTYITIIGNFTDTYGAPLEIEDGYVSGIGENCTVSELASRMKYASLTVLAPTGAELGDNEKIVTGCTVKFEWCGKAYLTKTAVIRGDVNCDGKIDSADCALIKKAATGTVTLTGANREAARFTGGEDITIDDYTALRLYVAGK